jgi:predicted nucleotidyltransferase
MRTDTVHNSIGSVLFSKNRRAVLALLFGHPDQAYYFRQIVRACGGGVGAVQRELAQLAAAGIVRRTIRGNQVYFQADESCPIFQELKGLVVKTAGVADVLRVALAPLAGRIAVAFLFGSVARAGQRCGSDVHLVVVGDVSFSEVVTATAKAQQQLAREVNPVVYSPEEFRSNVLAGYHFLSRVLTAEKIFLCGNENELAGLASKRLADGA